jgi:hypothetical protein
MMPIGGKDAERRAVRRESLGHLSVSRCGKDTYIDRVAPSSKNTRENSNGDKRVCQEARHDKEIL